MDDHSKKLARLLAKAWLDPAYEAKLRADPTATLHAAGLYEGKKVSLHEDSATTAHFVFHARPKSLTDDDLRKTEPHPDLCCTVCFV